MQIDDFLNGRSIANLQTLQWFWTPASRRSSSKSELLRLLRQEMLSPERARKGFQDLDAPCQELLRGLLRHEGYRGDVAFVARRLANPPPTPQAQRQILDELARRGFLHYHVTRSPNQYESFDAEVPQELGDVLAEVLNLDTREPALMLGLSRFLAHLPPEERERLVGADLSAEEALERLLQPDAIAARVAALTDPAMRQAVGIALESHAGILPLERFPSLGLDIEAVDAYAWRTALESQLLGTFGHLSLLEYGLSDDHECLVVYQEIVGAQAAAQARTDPPASHVYACGIDFVTDLAATCDLVRAEPAKLTSAGRFFKGTRNQLLPRTALRTTFFMDEESLHAFKLTVARELGLVEVRPDDRLHATRASIEWENRSLPDQARSVLDVMLALGETPASKSLFRDLAAVARQALLESPPGTWLPTNAFFTVLLSRCLLRLMERGPARAGTHSVANVSPGASPSAPWDYSRPADSLASVAAAAREPLLRALNYAGLVDIGRRGDQSFVRATPLVGVVLGEAPPAAPPQRLLIVNPDAEVILFPEGNHIELLHRLCGFCERGKSEVTLHLRITRESVQGAVLRGLDAESMLATLRDHCRVPLSQNIEYSIRSWAESVYPAEVQTLHVLELPSPAIADAAAQLPEIAPLILRRLSPTALALTVPQLGPEAEAALKQLGVHLM